MTPNKPETRGRKKTGQMPLFSCRVPQEVLDKISCLAYSMECSEADAARKVVFAGVKEYEYLIK